MFVLSKCTTSKTFVHFGKYLWSLSNHDVQTLQGYLFPYKEGETTLYCAPRLEIFFFFWLAQDVKKVSFNILYQAHENCFVLFVGTRCQA